ncbi:hypothetical protein QJS04_geneDACA003485 [Acorus gramineus]|uniref:Uncharacterized protein n=1 Tax=Acorus gramineus TaxID=55184 RepID=A0AAV9BQR5_ACOGR|nr:hypothetical protein QJS04_geneDACA003485 [Acorus gramineus]
MFETLIQKKFTSALTFTQKEKNYVCPNINRPPFIFSVTLPETKVFFVAFLLHLPSHFRSNKTIFLNHIFHTKLNNNKKNLNLSKPPPSMAESKETHIIEIPSIEPKLEEIFESPDHLLLLKF